MRGKLKVCIDQQLLAGKKSPSLRLLRIKKKKTKKKKV